MRVVMLLQRVDCFRWKFHWQFRLELPFDLVSDNRYSQMLME
jgi:hypothetical protein